MSEHHSKEANTPLEYIISGLVVLLFGLLYVFLNHSKDFTSVFSDGTSSLSTPVITTTAKPGISNKLLADNTGDIEMPVVEDEAQPTAAAEDQSLTEAATARVQQADKKRMAIERALREQLAAERARADEATRQLQEAQKLLATEKTRRIKIAKQPITAPTPIQQVAPAAPKTGKANSTQAPVYRLPNGTEIPVSDEGFEGIVKAAMAQQAADDTTLMSQPMLFDDIWFESGSDQLSNSSQNQIRVVAALMNTYQNRKILIRGHTDNTGDLNTNSLLSLTRSDSMRKQLVSLGIDPARIKIEGVGQLEPLASNNTAEGRAQNRRIELVLTE